MVSPLQPKQYYEYEIFKIRNRNNSIWIKPSNDWEEIQLSTNSNRKLKFYFPFFGHMIQHVRMLYSGIISLSDFDHLGNIHESQYIAPMMADFAYEDPKCKGFVLDNGNMAVFTWTNLLVVVAELDGPETEALDLVPLITNTVLEEHHLIGMISHKKSLITIFGHKHRIKNFIKNLIFFIKKFQQPSILVYI